VKVLPPPRLTLYFPNQIIMISGMYCTTIVSLKYIPAPLTIGGSCKGVKRCTRTRTTIARPVKVPDRYIREATILYLFIYCRQLSLAISFYRQRQRRRPMTTIPTRLARVATVSTGSVQQRKRVLDLYREWIRGVRSFYFAFARSHLSTLLLLSPLL
jgi:hypothetical protein